MLELGRAALLTADVVLELGRAALLTADGRWGSPLVLRVELAGEFGDADRGARSAA